jgi:hypothetical protein
MPAMSSFKEYTIIFPEDMSEETPVVVFNNGTGIKASKYTAVLEHLASWGFITIGTEEEHSWYGFSAEMSVRLMEKLNGTKVIEGWDSNPFYNRVDLNNVGISGHSQGGVAVFNAITDTRHKEVYKCAFSASPTNKSLAQNLMWDYDASKIDIPIFLVSGTGDIDEKFVISGNQIKSIYNDIQDSPFKIMARRNDADHGDMLQYANGYMTAFFMWQLRDDMEAATAFLSDDAEILSNPLYQDQRIN